MDGLAEFSTPLFGRHAPAYFTDRNLNADGSDHAVQDEQAGTLSWEDQLAGGDLSYDDVRVQLAVTGGQPGSTAVAALLSPTGSGLDQPQAPPTEQAQPSAEPPRTLLAEMKALDAVGEWTVGLDGYSLNGASPPAFLSDPRWNADCIDHVRDVAAPGNMNWEDQSRVAIRALMISISMSRSCWSRDRQRW